MDRRQETYKYRRSDLHSLLKWMTRPPTLVSPQHGKVPFRIASAPADGSSQPLDQTPPISPTTSDGQDRPAAPAIAKPSVDGGAPYNPVSAYAKYLQKRAENLDMIKDAADDLRKGIPAGPPQALTNEEIQQRADLAMLEVLGSKKGSVEKALQVGRSRYDALIARFAS